MCRYVKHSKSQLGKKIMKTFVAMVVTVCLITNVALAFDNELWEKTEKARNLAIFPGFFCHGIGSFHLGDTKTGMAYLGLQVCSVLAIYSGIKMDPGYGMSALFFTPLKITLIGIGVVGYLSSWKSSIDSAYYYEDKSAKKKDEINIALVPVLSPDYSGIILAKKF